MTSLSDFVSEQRSKNQSSIGQFTNSLKSIAIGQRLSGAISNFSGRKSGDDDVNDPLLEGERKNSDASTGSSWFGMSNRKSSTDNGSDCFGLGYVQRVALTMMFLVMAAICFVSAGFLIPVLVFYTKKFATLNTIGCLCLMTGLSFFVGWRNFIRVLVSDKRRTVSITYIMSIILTLFASLSVSFSNKDKMFNKK
uniref:Vesicle transport protein n=1 Tax=Strongyloides papillosus TaxID=174720 RepID=A0A0N5C662_STREA